MTKLISLERLSQFWTKIKEYFNPKIEKVNKKIWKGTQAEFEVALASGLIDETTTILITDLDNENLYGFATYEEILAMFPQYA